ncbi:MAG: hypothetical protein IPO27_08390 [Bacteroidetes bacterium]|nr:hypothetical protein [Bacteroidota bacterium]
MGIRPGKLKNPFVGLRSYEEEEDYLFFGRSAEINDLLKKFSTSRFLAVLGSSGSGKSSLVKSGFLPAIYSGFLSAGHNWRVALMRPGDNPIGNLSQALAQDSVLYNTAANPEIPRSAIIEAVLRRSGNGLINVYDRANLTETENLLIIVDQFEELFRFNRFEKLIHEERSDALNFINLLLTAASQTVAPIYVLITMRSDFLGDCSQFRGLPEAINSGQYLVPRMTRDQIREAINGPIKISGTDITPRLLTKLLNDLGNNTDQLPILQHALMRTWDAWHDRNQPDAFIDMEDYEKIGSLETALSQHADIAYGELNEPQQKICELMFKALTDITADARGTRRPQNIKELSDISKMPESEVIKVVDVFRKQGRTFLMTQSNVTNLSSDSIIDISHESIMRIWERLLVWNKQEAESGKIFIRLAEDAQLYFDQRLALYRDGDPELAIAAKWYKDTNPNAEWAKRYKGDFEKAIVFLKKSEESARQEQEEKKRIARKKRRYAIGVAIFFGLLALAGAIIAIWTNSLKEEAVTAKKLSDSAAVYADSVRVVSDTLRAEAIRDKENAILLEAAADSAKDVAEEQTKLAEKKTKEVEELLDQLEQEQLELEKTYKALVDKSRKIAASAYKDSIREGPTSVSEIKKSSYDVKLVAYLYHLAYLNDKAKNIDLYPKVFASLTANDNKDLVLAQISSIGFSDTVALGNNAKILRGKNKSKIVLNLEGHQVELTKEGNTNIECLTANASDSLIFCATDNNSIEVYKYNNRYKLSKQATILMNGLVTAIDYNAANKVIYFGLRTGEIGYIQYSNNTYEKIKPVYENELGSRVTSIDFFEYKSKYYLLASSQRGKVTVYDVGNVELGNVSSFLIPDKKLTGIELPINLREIQYARFDEAKGKVLLAAAKGNYSWNPFTEEIVELLKNEINKNRKSDLEKISNETKWY